MDEQSEYDRGYEQAGNDLVHEVESAIDAIMADHQRAVDVATQMGKFAQQALDELDRGDLIGVRETLSLMVLD